MGKLLFGNDPETAPGKKAFLIGKGKNSGQFQLFCFLKKGIDQDTPYSLASIGGINGQGADFSEVFPYYMQRTRSHQAAVFFRHEKLFARAIACRKHPLRLAPLLGFRLMPQLLVRSLTVAAIEARIAARLGVEVAAIESRFSEMGFDIDTEADLEWIEFYWGGALVGRPRIEPELEGE